MKVDIEKGNANGRLDYLELPKLDAKTRSQVAGLTTSASNVGPITPQVGPAATSVAPEKGNKFPVLPYLEPYYRVGAVSRQQWEPMHEMGLFREGGDLLKGRRLPDAGVQTLDAAARGIASGSSGRGP